MRKRIKIEAMEIKDESNETKRENGRLSLNAYYGSNDFRVVLIEKKWKRNGSAHTRTLEHK